MGELAPRAGARSKGNAKRLASPFFMRYLYGHDETRNGRASTNRPAALARRSKGSDQFAQAHACALAQAPPARHGMVEQSDRQGEAADRITPRLRAQIGTQCLFDLRQKGDSPRCWTHLGPSNHNVQPRKDSHIMATQIIPRPSGAATTRSGTSKEAAAPDGLQYYRSLPPRQRTALAIDMALEISQHYDRARSLLMALTTQLRQFADEDNPTALHLAEIAEEWMEEPGHLAQEHRLMACLRASEEVSHA
ncbi:hypothetical protein E5CHR_04238 [Variovorax sp. PBL-E5]|nr:hypothetical protein E5CHR_04238 [Variovorax sp. PBL-E5]